MRERCPVAHSEFMGWSLFRHEDIEAVLTDPVTYSNASRFLAIPNGMDPPTHGRYREALAGFFESGQLDLLEPRARAIAVTLLEPSLASGSLNIIDAFATPFVLKTLCAWLGWPEQQWQCLGGWIHGNQQTAFTRDHAAGAALASLFSEHVRANLAVHRTGQREVADATDALLRVEVDGKPFDDEEIVSLLRNWTAGQGTVAAGLGILVMHLAEDAALQQRLRLDPSLIPAAIEEILRADDPLVANRRVATRDVEIQGRRIPKGESLTLMWIAANRDPRAFDDPDAIEITRRSQKGLLGKGHPSLPRSAAGQARDARGPRGTAIANDACRARRRSSTPGRLSQQRIRNIRSKAQLKLTTHVEGQSMEEQVREDYADVPGVVASLSQARLWGVLPRTTFPSQASLEIWRR
jgi:cytochrome P450